MILDEKVFSLSKPSEDWSAEETWPAITVGAVGWWEWIKGHWQWIAGGVGAAAAIGVTVVLVKKRK